MAQLSDSVTSSIAMIGATLPNLTLPNFEISAGYTDGMGGIMAAAFAPYVRGEQRAAWEEYATLNQDWVARGKYLKERHPFQSDPLHGTIQDHEHDRRHLEETATPIHKEVWRFEDRHRVPVKSEPGQLLAPFWQVSPPSEVSVNCFPTRPLSECTMSCSQPIDLFS